jgi:hypothetical protein
VPFTKTRGGKYKTPSGRTYTRRQVKAYYATGGWKRPVRKQRRRG